MTGIILLLYVLVMVILLSGFVMVTYHLLAFRLNRSLAWFMIIMMWTGGLLLLIANLYYYNNIDWETFVETFFY